MRYTKTLFILPVLCLALLTSLPPHAAAASTTKTNSTDTGVTQAVTQSYNADASVQIGMIVMLKAGDGTSVVPLTDANISNMLGVTVQANDATVTLTPQTINATQVYVATKGRYQVLVSTQNGPVRSGDYITISSLGGVGMKADNNHPVILGKAVSGFNGTSNVRGNVELKDSQGKTFKVAIGTAVIDLDISHNPLSSTSTDYVPGFLSKASVAVAGKPVSAARIYLSLLLLLISAVVTGTIVYSGVRNGMKAIGRNPLSKKSIIRSLIQTVIAGMIIFVTGVFAVYLILKL